MVDNFEDHAASGHHESAVLLDEFPSSYSLFFLTSPLLLAWFVWYFGLLCYLMDASCELT